MGIRILGKGTRIFDCAGDPRHYDIAATKWQVHSAYLGHKYGITPNQVAAVIANGMLIQWNWEAHGNEAFGGYQAGVEAVTEAVAIAESFGWTNGESPIIFSGTDVGIPKDAWPICDEFYRACWERTWAGMYGPLAYLFHTTEIPNVPANFVRWHWGGDRPYQDWSYVDVQQIYPALEPEETGLACRVDDNYQVADSLTYWAGPGPNPVEETEMPEYRHTDDGAVYELANGFKWPVSGPYFYNALNGCLFGQDAPNPGPGGRVVTSYPATHEAIDAIPTGSFGSAPAPTPRNVSGTWEGTISG